MADELEKAINAIKISREEAIHFFNKLEKKVFDYSTEFLSCVDLNILTSFSSLMLVVVLMQNGVFQNHFLNGNMYQ